MTLQIWEDLVMIVIIPTIQISWCDMIFYTQKFGGAEKRNKQQYSDISVKTFKQDQRFELIYWPRQKLRLKQETIEEVHVEKRTIFNEVIKWF